MHAVLRQFHRSRLTNVPTPLLRRGIADSRPFAPGDVVLLQEKLRRDVQPIFTRPLKPGSVIQSHLGVIWHNDIIGKRVRDVVTSRTRSKKEGENDEPKPGTEFRVHEVKLEDYARLTKRLVTPVYPADAAVIVELLDLHPGAVHQDNAGATDDEPPKLEILEAGTGHGALTLYLSRAIHAANAHLPPPDISSPSALEEYKRNRKAILHTIEAKEKYSSHARSVVAGFRHGLYYANVDFHISPVGDWVRQALADRNNTPFLSHAILDMPNADRQLADVAAALRLDGTCVVFNPSLTQILECVKRVKQERITLNLDSVIELPANGGAGGREWDVRAVRPRVLVAAEAESTSEGEDDEARREDGWHMVCRPKVGERIVGGGFLGVFKKWSDVKVV